MSDKSNIEWTEATWNPVTGCTKVSAGCKHCYAERDWVRLSANPKTRYYGRAFTDVMCHGDVLDLPVRWSRPRRIFVNSMSDLFHPDVPDWFIADVFGIMAAAGHHTFQVLTKRPERALDLLGQGCMGRFQSDVEESLALYSDADLVWPLPNIWLGVSVEDQAAADERIPLLLQTPAAVRWVSAEPLLGPVALPYYDQYCSPDGFENNGPMYRTLGISTEPDSRIDWVVVGGESGPKARPMHPAWARSLRDQCAAAGVPFLFKQWGEWGKAWGGCTHLFYQDGTLFVGTHEHPDAWKHKTAETIARLGKKAAGRLLDGVQHDDYPG